MASLTVLLTTRLTPAFAVVAGPGVPAPPALRASAHADFQADGALALARRLGRKPRDVAAEVIAAADLGDVCERVEVAGPGFVNLVVRREAIEGLLGEMAADVHGRLGVTDQKPEVVVVDYSAPNVAKEMHVGHLRSTIIGDAICRIDSFLGHSVIRQNHLGDWGTPFGMLVEHLLDIGEDEAIAELSVGDLNGFYQEARRKFVADPSFVDRSRRRVVALQNGDEQTLRLWRMLCEQSSLYFQRVYERLGVLLTPEDHDGESRYNPLLQSVVDELSELGLIEVSDGALCVFPPGFANRQGDPLPLIVKKADGGFGYAATDLATIRLRVREFQATRIAYVVGSPQRTHFEMIFVVARMAGWIGDRHHVNHVGFGSVLGADRKMLRTRSGATLRLIDLLDEAVGRAASNLREKRPDLDGTDILNVADAVGIGAVKYADLSNDRTNDYVFDWDRMLSFDGNTAPYLQYAHTRIRSIFRRAGEERPAASSPRVTEQPERALALQLLGFEDAVHLAAERYQPHRLCTYLFALATAFTAFYESCPVVNSDPATREARLALCDLTSNVLATGLRLLGIEAPQQM